MRARMLLPTLVLLAFAARAAIATEAPKDARSLEYELAFRGHPDLEYRMYGVDAWRKGQYARALTLLRRAARYGDKPAQGLIAEMHATGQGVTADRALAYAWMDLAAERGYRDFVIRRERLWARMSEAERQRAIEEGQAVYAEYGDDVAKPRFAEQLRREARNGVGSRTGYGGNAKITLSSQFGDQTLDASQYRSASFWDADKYWALQHALWTTPGGRVDSGGLEDVHLQPVHATTPASAGQ